MISITDKHNCCGCAACVQRCPKHCISFLEDEEGFSYPKIDTSICVDCGLCERVCPVLNQGEAHNPLQAYAAINPDEAVRAKSSSGGIFTSMAEKVICAGGVVFGARFNGKWEVVHDYTDTMQGLATFRGSKYVQSSIGDSFKKAEALLKEGRTVLFSGTSCQIAGLNHYLRHSYENLITTDVVCHGVPSPKLWREYLQSISPTYKISDVIMKDKAENWRGYRITVRSKEGVLSERASQNKFMLAFSQNLSLRPSCYQCPAKAGKSGSDITLADYWGIEKLIPSMDDSSGTSFVCANTPKGQALLDDLSLRKVKADYDASIPYNACIVKSTAEPELRAAFWKQYKENGIKALDTLKPNKTNIIKRALRWLERRIK